jgi:hypothetical protein
MLGGVLVALLIYLLVPSAALASQKQISIFEDDMALANNPGATLQELRHLGVDMVRVGLHWSYVAPNPTWHRQPSFNAVDPNAYPPGAWDAYDTIVRDATADGLKVLFVPTAFAPVWAQGPNPGRYHAHNTNMDQAFEPNTRDYGQFVQAAATRYSGHFTPPGAVTPLPRVSYWEIYNEPNFGEDIAPQAIDGSKVLYAPIIYRALLNAGWSALHASGHGGDTILIGALAAHGLQGPPGPHAPEGYPGTYGETKPLSFIRALYCVDNTYHAYRGAAAAMRSCPTNAGGSARFRSQNPALFNASGFSDHPYPSNQPPNQSVANDPNATDFSQLSNLASTLDLIQRIYRSSKRFPIWNTEYSYITDPPNASRPSGRQRRCRCHYVSPATAASYINWAEYLSWENPRIASTMQYLLYDPNPRVGTPEFGGFSSGLLYFATVLGGGPKTGYFAYRLPIYMPKTSTRLGNTLQVWGDVRPARFAIAGGDGPQYVQVQFQQPGGPWITEKTLRVSDPHGYFETSVAFPSSGWVRIAWSYPTLDTSLGSALVTPSTSVGPNGYFEPLTATNSRSVKITVT